MTDVDRSIMNPIESVLSMVPGASGPIGRTVIGGGIGGTYAFVAKPSVSFTADGAARPWILINSSDPEGTIFPWWAWIVVPATVFGVLI
jgi:hypothetical protein